MLCQGCSGCAVGFRDARDSSELQERRGILRGRGGREAKEGRKEGEPEAGKWPSDWPTATGMPKGVEPGLEPPPPSGHRSIETSSWTPGDVSIAPSAIGASNQPIKDS